MGKRRQSPVKRGHIPAIRRQTPFKRKQTPVSIRNLVGNFSNKKKKSITKRNLQYHQADLRSLKKTFPNNQFFFNSKTYSLPKDETLTSKTYCINNTGDFNMNTTINLSDDENETSVSEVLNPFSERQGSRILHPKNKKLSTTKCDKTKTSDSILIDISDDSGCDVIDLTPINTNSKNQSTFSKESRNPGNKDPTVINLVEDEHSKSGFNESDDIIVLTPEPNGKKGEKRKACDIPEIYEFFEDRTPSKRTKFELPKDDFLTLNVSGRQSPQSGNSKKSKKRKKKKKISPLNKEDTANANVYIEKANNLPKSGLRPVIIDGSNIAWAHSNNMHFSCKGLEICINYFKEKGHEVTAFVPQYRKHPNHCDDPKLLDKLIRQGDVVLTPSRKIDGKRITSYDDRYIVQTATLKGGVIVTRDNYTDLLREDKSWAETIKYRLLPYTWVGDLLIFPKDPLGCNGPSLDKFLRFS